MADNKPKVYLLEKLGTKNHPSTPESAAVDLEKVLGEMWDSGYVYGGHIARYLNGADKLPRFYLVFNPLDRPNKQTRTKTSE